MSPADADTVDPARLADVRRMLSDNVIREMLAEMDAGILRQMRLDFDAVPPDRVRGTQANGILVDETASLPPGILAQAAYLPSTPPSAPFALEFFAFETVGGSVGHVGDLSRAALEPGPREEYMATHSLFMPPPFPGAPGVLGELLADVAGGDLGVAAVLADWLEDQGRGREAASVRKRSGDDAVRKASARFTLDAAPALAAARDLCLQVCAVFPACRAWVKEVRRWHAQSSYIWRADPLGRQAADAINNFTRAQLREDGFARRIMPPLVIGNDELDRMVDTDRPVRVVDQGVTP